MAENRASAEDKDAPPADFEKMKRRTLELYEETARLHEENATLLRQLIEARDGLQADRDGRRAALNLMEDAVAARNSEKKELDERRRAEVKLLEADSRKNEFLATLAHELRNPLAPIRNCLQLLRMSTPTDSATQHIYDVLDRQVNYMVRLVEDLMDISRITRGIIELRKEVTDLAAIIKSAVETSQPLIDAMLHKLTVKIPPEPIPLYGDVLRLAQVFGNLLNNAAKYTDKGGKIWLTACQDGRDVVVSVRDSGIGISAAMLPSVFDLFTQADRARAAAQGGLGIGLTLVKRLVEMHGGTIAARSEGPGKGSEFIVRLPAVIPLSLAGKGARGGGKAPAPIDGHHAPRAPYRHVLIVDDNEDAAASLQMLLATVGVDAQIANDGLTALQIIEQTPPELVFLDIGMPDMDGYEAARRIRQRHGANAMVLVALTGWGQPHDRKRTHEAGFNYHLVKPADLEEVKALVGGEIQERWKPEVVEENGSDLVEPAEPEA
jgi:signal transduction histidine kinase/ActR/RegA family two-component response regulator